MEGGSPAAIWKRWTLPMYAAQHRYWRDHPRDKTLLRLLAAVHYKSLRKPPTYTSKTTRIARPAVAKPLPDWAVASIVQSTPPPEKQAYAGAPKGKK